MSLQVRMSASDEAPVRDHGDGAQSIAADLAYLRLSIVNVVFIGLPRSGDRAWTLVDTGLPTSYEAIATVAEKRFGVGARPAAILLTHGHFDHAGAVATLADAWDAPVYAHPLEKPYLDGSAFYPPADPNVGGGLLARLSPLFPRSPVDLGQRLQMLPQDGSVPATPGWRWLHTPGHAPGHVSFWREADRTLIAGDAFITTGQESAYEVAMQTLEMHGPPRYLTTDWQAAEHSVRQLSALEPNLVLTGHGRPAAGLGMQDALRRLASDFQRIAAPDDGEYVRHPAKAEDASAYRQS